jgi:hypothetical protein
MTGLDNLVDEAGDAPASKSPGAMNLPKSP